MATQIRNASQNINRNQDFVYYNLFDVYKMMLATVVLYDIFQRNAVETQRVVSLLFRELFFNNRSFNNFLALMYRYNAAITVSDRAMYRQEIEVYVGNLGA
jgi:hypothetical protein